MKKLTILFLLTALSINLAVAQKDADAQKILNTLSKKYKSYDLIKADFSFTLEDQQAGIKQTQTGTLISRPKANKFKVSIYNPTDKASVTQEIISDGKSQ